MTHENTARASVRCRESGVRDFFEIEEAHEARPLLGVLVAVLAICEKRSRNDAPEDSPLVQKTLKGLLAEIMEDDMRD